MRDNGLMDVVNCRTQHVFSVHCSCNKHNFHDLFEGSRLMRRGVRIRQLKLLFCFPFGKSPKTTYRLLVIRRMHVEDQVCSA